MRSPLRLGSFNEAGEGLDKRTLDQAWSSEPGSQATGRVDRWAKHIRPF